MKECEIIYSQELNSGQKAYLWELLVLADNEFVPPLSDRNSTVQKELISKNKKEAREPRVYYEIMLQQHFLLAVASGEVIGFMSYIPDHTVELQDSQSMIADYVSTVVVHPDYRGSGVTEQLYRFLMNQKVKGKIATRTWSTNHAHLHILQKMGFSNIYTIKDDRGAGIDTVYYCKTI